ncbi:MAG: dihydrolipoyl dehydrogenase [Burkholderiaceae bacterium]|jgi:dihydrolipoamide dehydrogenase|nr:dihydrolipoyl dehydrogenase [Burkholderiales bacterium]MCZ8099091.1 dihydrolipoyl dehydrogenase [Burkholderiales bacterium]MCZ8340025.1 dihydrolipoyl dehydrogenase [Burkholderiaceae bacterium]
MASERYDVVVIGAGPAGYIAAIRAAQLGLKVACAEKWTNPKGELALGGTCLNVGCIPSKALLASSEKYEEALHHLDEHGIEVGSAKIDLAKMLARKDGIVSKMTKGIEFLFRKNKIIWLKGHARFTGENDGMYGLEVQTADGVQLVDAKHVIVATGSKARHLPGLPVDNELVCDNVGALALSSVPKKLAVIGAGVIGLELGSVWRRLGSDVTVLEALPGFLAACDEAVSKEAWKVFTKQGLKIHLGVKIGEVKAGKKGVSIAWTDAQGAAQVLEADRLIVSVGRVPNTEGLNLEAINLATDERGFIPVDDHCATKMPNVYAIGDVVRGPMLAHKGEDEGVMVAELIAGQKPHIDYNTIPWVIYTSPEIAWVGKTEQQLKAEGRAFRAGQFPFMANGRALGMNAAEGFVKVLADATTDEVLGVHIIAHGASDLIAEAAVAMEFKASSEDIARVCHPHPSMSEVMREAALAVDKRALNM